MHLKRTTIPITISVNSVVFNRLIHHFLILNVWFQQGNYYIQGVALVPEMQK